ncbi:MAG: hypothetical protein FD143_1422 [Ignavibacteria bacterium]|nr:MAG: hypothetical protein FD143_1422 [Ignavibacteria bacterium]KAF0160575.1 MAG: hypothetical protein FD188_1646 [Ignavibacteria bacterium]
MASTKRKIFTYLLFTALALLLVNIAVDLFTHKTKKPVASELSRTEIENTFWKVLDDYGINAEWVKKKKFREEHEDSINAQFLVTLPAEVPIPLIIKDINNVIEKDITGFVSKEMQIFGATEIRIYTNEMLKLKATLTPDPKLARNRNDFSFIISDAFTLSDKKFSDFLNVTYPVAAAIVPDTDELLKVDSLQRFSKEYVLLINNDIDDSKMKLVQEYQKELLRSSIRNILSAFPNAKYVTVEERSKLFNSPIYNFVRDEFKKRRFTVFPLSEFIRLETEDEQELVSKFKFYSEDTTASRQKVFYLTLDNFGKITPLIVKYKKQGSKIVPVSKSYLSIKQKN